MAALPTRQLHQFSPTWIGVGELGRQARLRVVVVIDDGLLDPGEAQAIDRPAGLERGRRRPGPG